ncbi:mediator of RNA polymerase II transcription subunit 15-like [Schistocerca americana]|uniref:mediator of RNA polymerase II transcription subunit 15-like n=1 Tax=Schistocerca americana TaxID=7009 RepID=UPI001F4FB736|nr:mediator of RNA polymerase II transcription subunit 15-like [Schistocerca americana]XP_046996411.1 mediator of RNA polymerase II transcription subunit 15-like [Schistocerca americana]XP_049962484.1 mediator of RNA polymerase II transcription subunit 15-like [Schistocerca serialis cubense]
MDVVQFLEREQTMLWRSPACRLCTIMQLEHTLQRYGTLTTMSSPEIENYMFQRATSQIEYMELLARFVFHIGQFSQKKGRGMAGSDGGAAQTILDPINLMLEWPRQDYTYLRPRIYL